MKKLVLLFIIITSCFGLSAQDLNDAKEIVKTLSSPEFKGRGYVGNGHKIAAKYISKQYAEIGLKSFGKNYFQPFEINANTFPSKMELLFNGEELIPGENYIIDPKSASLKGEFPTVVIREQDLMDKTKFADVVENSLGKVLIIDEIKSDIKDKEDKKKIKKLIDYLKYNPDVPSVATIIYTDKKLTWGGSTIQKQKTSFIVNKELNPESINEVSINVKAKFIKCETQNVVGYIEGTEKPDSFLVMLGHYDHLGKMGSKMYIPGANDNASGISMLLSLAKYYKENPHKYSIVFISLAAEEMGILGAKHYVANPLFDLNQIRFLVNFDMAGTGDEGIKVVNGTVFRKEYDLLNEINKENNYIPSVNIRGESCNSDHCMFHQQGVPSFFIYTMGGIQAYHDIYDRFETLPFTAFKGYSELMINFFDTL
ncbi:M28 family peptidase [Prolixibacteraceae bacterium Z1-6]|uniref:M28 family peptidase n=1 Tax=Draconibacterium aestuarii TaxID=2998507 RepID=A0A9X3J2V7_9BACT|nr:M28 family peptidase [Prolixibacteraceae bacterium Z1-6]